MCALLVCVGLASFFPYFPRIHSANELSRLLLADALVVDGSVSIDGAIARWGSTPDKAKREGRYYSDKAPGVAFLAVPALWCYRAVVETPTLAGEMRVARLVASTLPTLLLLFMLIAFLRERIDDGGLRLALLLGYGAGSLATTYGLVLFGHQLSAAVMFGLFLAVRRAHPELRARHALAIGVLSSASVVVEYQSAFLMAPLAGLYLWKVRGRPRAIVLALIGMIPLTALLLTYHASAFGSPFKTGYSFIDSPYFRAVHERGLLGVDVPQAQHAMLSFLSPAKGLFFFSPFLALSVPGFLCIRRAGSDATTAIALAVLYALFVSSMVFPGGGWTVSQRHLAPLVPFLLWPVGAAVSRWSGLRAPFLAMVAVSIAFTSISTVVWPYLFDSLKNPVFQLAWPLARDGWFPPSIAGSIGVSSRALFVGWMACATAVLIRIAARWYGSGHLGRTGVVVVLLWAGAHVAIARRIEVAQSSAAERERVERDYVLDPLASPIPRTPAGAGRQRGSTPFK